MPNSYLAYVTAEQPEQVTDISDVTVIEWGANYVKLSLESPAALAFGNHLIISNEPVTVIYGPQGNEPGAIRYRAKFRRSDVDLGGIILRRIEPEIKDAFY